MNCKQASELSAFDIALLNLIQNDFPLVERPYAVLADRLDVCESLILSRLAELKAAGYIRRLGPFFDVAGLGYTSTLVAAHIESAELDQVARAVNALPGVTHNYEREAEFNLWFTLISEDHEQETTTLNKIASLPGVKRLMSLPAGRKFKVDVRFQLK